MQNHMKALHNQNKILFELSNKTSNLRELNKINNIKKAMYNYSSRDNSSVSVELDSRKYSLYPLSDLEVEIP